MPRAAVNKYFTGRRGLGVTVAGRLAVAFEQLGVTDAASRLLPAAPGDPVVVALGDLLRRFDDFEARLKHLEEECGRLFGLDRYRPLLQSDGDDPRSDPPPVGGRREVRRAGD